MLVSNCWGLFSSLIGYIRLSIPCGVLWIVVGICCDLSCHSKTWCDMDSVQIISNLTLDGQEVRQVFQVTSNAQILVSQIFKAYFSYNSWARKFSVQIWTPHLDRIATNKANFIGSLNFRYSWYSHPPSNRGWVLGTRSWCRGLVIHAMVWSQFFVSVMDVQFSILGVTAPYNIIAVEGLPSKGYEAALVYSCTENHVLGTIQQAFFVLSRRPTLLPATLNRFLGVAASLGTDLDCENPFLTSGCNCVPFVESCSHWTP